MNRQGVEYFISDMWKPYESLSAALFPNATYLVDKYHYIRQAIWAFESVRKQEQQRFNATHRKYFKRSKRLLTSRFKKLSDENQKAVNVMLYASSTLSSAHFLKEQFLTIFEQCDGSKAKQMLREWIKIAQESDIPQFVACANTYSNWLSGILNTFDVPFTNGFTEGCNNKIKVLKRNAYGYRNFNRFRNRILFMFSHQRANLSKNAVA